MSMPPLEALHLALAELIDPMNLYPRRRTLRDADAAYADLVYYEFVREGVEGTLYNDHGLAQHTLAAQHRIMRVMTPWFVKDLTESSMAEAPADAKPVSRICPPPQTLTSSTVASSFYVRGYYRTQKLILDCVSATPQQLAKEVKRLKPAVIGGAHLAVKRDGFMFECFGYVTVAVLKLQEPEATTGEQPGAHRDHP